MVDVTLGALIKDGRVAKGWTQGDLSKQTGISVSFISDIERGDRVPRLNNLRKFAQALEISSEKLTEAIRNSGSYLEAKQDFAETPAEQLTKDETRKLEEYKRFLIAQRER